MSVPEAPTLTGRRNRLLLIGILIPTIALGSYWYFYIRIPCLAEFRAGGMRMTLVKIVEGRLLHRVTDPVPFWIRTNVPAINRIVPFRFTGNFDSAEFFSPHGSNWFLFHMKCPPNVLPPLTSMLFAKVELDSDGFFIPLNQATLMGEYFALYSDAVPRRSRRLKIRATELNGNVIEHSVDNPFFQERFPDWTPGPFPTESTRGPFTVELTDFHYRSDGGVHPVVRCQCSDPRLEPCGVWATLEDVTGNQGPFVSPLEKTWKVVARVSVPLTAQSPLNQRFPIGKFSVPPANTVVPWTTSSPKRAVNLPIRAVVGPGTYELIRGNWQVASGKDPNAQVTGPAILMEYGALALTDTLHVKSAGQSHLKQSGGAKATSFEARSWIELHEFQSGDELELELVRSQPERFEFLVPPPEEARQLRIPHIPGD